jgi:hypothetical protein
MDSDLVADSLFEQANECVRIGERCRIEGKQDSAVLFLSQAVELGKHHVHYQDSIRNVEHEVSTMLEHSIVLHRTIYSAATICLLLVSGVWITCHSIRRHKKGELSPSIDYDCFRKELLANDIYKDIRACVLQIGCIENANEKAVVEKHVKTLVYSLQEELLPTYRLHLKDKYPKLSDDDLYFCILRLLGLSAIEIGCCIGRTRDAVYKKEKPLLKKMGVDETVDLLELLLNV